MVNDYVSRNINRYSSDASVHVCMKEGVENQDANK